MTANDTLIPTRFLATIGHMITVLMIFNTRAGNIRASLAVDATSVDYDDADSSLLAGLWLAMLCFAIELIGQFAGFTLFKPVHNCVLIFCHFWGCLFLCWFMLDSWHYLSFWYTFIFFNAVPVIMEIVGILATCACKKVQYY
jgi:hypothetical protein